MFSTDLVCDVSRIPDQREVEGGLPSQPFQLPPPSQQTYVTRRSAAINLSTINEECSSHSTISSRSSNTTTSSQSGHESTGSDHDLDIIKTNPFSPEIVNMMLNALSPSVMDSVHVVSSTLPQLASGHTVRLGDCQYSNVKKMTSGGFGTIYTCKQGRETKVLKVYIYIYIYMF